MKAVVQDGYGSADVFALEDVEPPQITDDHVLVRVAAAGVDRAVWHIMTGTPYMARPAFGLRKPKNRVPGMDLAGVVEAVGPAVTRFSPGDEVFGLGTGAFASYASVSERSLARKPTNVTFAQAAAVAMSGLTALQALRDKAGVQAGRHVLVIGASGGVGHYAVQIAKAFGATVTGVCSTAKVDFVRSLGADHVVDYTREDVTSGSARYDAIIDINGGASTGRLLHILTDDGTIVLVGDETGGAGFGIVSRIVGAMVRHPFSRRRVRPFLSRANADDMQALAELIEAGDVTPSIDRVFALDQAADALSYLDEGRVRGKVVIEV